MTKKKANTHKTDRKILLFSEHHISTQPSSLLTPPLKRTCRSSGSWETAHPQHSGWNNIHISTAVNIYNLKETRKSQEVVDPKAIKLIYSLCINLIISSKLLNEIKHWWILIERSSNQTEHVYFDSTESGTAV